MPAFFSPEVRLSRRRLLQVGGLGMVGLSLPQLLQARAGSEGASGKPERSCIFVVLYGGLSHIDSWDPKPQAPEEIRGPFRLIATRVPGMQLCELQPQLARIADRFCLIRSMSHRNSGHQDGMDCCLTGCSQPTEQTPSFGSVMAKVRPATRNVPPYVWLQNLAGDADKLYRNGGFLGPVFGPMLIGENTNNPAAADFRVQAFDGGEGLSPERVADRGRLLAALDGTRSDDLPPSSMRRFQERALDLVTRPEAKQAFELQREPAGIRDRYGRHPLGQNLLLARRLIEAGVRLVSVNAFVGIPDGEKFRDVQTWDSHGDTGVNQGSIFGMGRCGLGFALPRLDQALSALVEDLEQRGLLESTLVAATGEFGRTPKLIGRGAPGRDHWPQCYTAFLAGAGMPGGAVYGASDRIGAFVKDNPASPEDFGATLLNALGVPPGTRLGADGFTRPASAGQPIPELSRS